jgi:hypothetical protein
MWFNLFKGKLKTITDLTEGWAACKGGEFPIMGCMQSRRLLLKTTFQTGVEFRWMLCKMGL